VGPRAGLDVLERYTADTAATPTRIQTPHSSSPCRAVITTMTKANPAAV